MMEKNIIDDGIKANDGIKVNDRIKANDDTTANDEPNRRRRLVEKFKSDEEETSPSPSSSSSSESSSLSSSVKNWPKEKPIVTNEATGKIHATKTKKKNYVSYALRAVCRMIGIPPSLCCRIGTNYDAHCPSSGWPANSRAMTMTMTMTGTLFGYRKGRMHWALQEDTRSAPGLLLELATPTSTLVREMASGVVRIALECLRAPSRGGAPRKLLDEPIWTMYCNGRKSGYAHRVGPCSYGDSWHALALSMVGAVSMGAGVLPLATPVSSPHTGKNLIDNDNDSVKPGNDKDNDHVDGVPCDQLMYMRARFERVVGNCDSEAYYMMNPDRTSGPELSIFLVRV